jgi:ABC-type lipoprotein release transport system permease subunit
MTLSGIWELKRMAFRNLARHKVKTILTSAAIMVSVAVYIFMDGLLGGMFIESHRNIINYEMGAAKLQTRMYFDKQDEKPAYENFAGWETCAAALDEAGYHSAPRYVFSGTLYSVTGNAPVIVNAVDPAREAATLAYTDPKWMETGRYIRPGEFGIALGNYTAEKLKVGIPQRVEKAEFEDFVLTAAAGDAADEAFIRSCFYQIEEERKAGFLETQDFAAANMRRMFLKQDLGAASLDRLWQLLDRTGRNDVRIATVIDIKGLPDSIRKDKWDVDLWTLLSPGEQALLGAAYEYDELLGAYLLIEDDDARLAGALAAMIRVDFSGAVKHVNQIIDANVVGIVNTPDVVLNTSTVFIPLDVLQDEAGMMLEGRVTEILIRDKRAALADRTLPSEEPEAITAALQRSLAAKGETLPAELGVFPWQGYNEDFLKYEAMENTSSRIFPILILIMALLGISNTILMSVMERTKEIGMMRALGMTDREMVFTYMMEAAALGLIGGGLGIVAGCLSNIPMVTAGMDYSSMSAAMGGNMGIPVSNVIRSIWNVPVIIGSGIVAALVSSLVAFFPVRSALKKPITESMRFE